jgi:hypothetical protein
MKTAPKKEVCFIILHKKSKNRNSGKIHKKRHGEEYGPYLNQRVRLYREEYE